MFRAKIRLSRAAAVRWNLYHKSYRAEKFRKVDFWANLMNAIFQFWNFLSKILKFQISKNTDSTKSLLMFSSNEFRVLMSSKWRCILVIVKKLHTQNFEILKFFEQKFCKTEISKLGMAITLAYCKLGSNNWCHFVRIGVLHRTFSWMKILKTLEKSQQWP
jgi:hypothetical protein